MKTCLRKKIWIPQAMAIFSGLEGFTSQLNLVEKCFGNVVLKKPKCLKSTALFQLPAQGNVYNKLNEC